MPDQDRGDLRSSGEAEPSNKSHNHSPHVGIGFYRPVSDRLEWDRFYDNHKSEKWGANGAGN